MAQKIASAGIVALKEALTSLYWYKKDLRSFLANTVTDAAILSRLNWNDYKRNIVSQLVDYMAQRQKPVSGRSVTHDDRSVASQ